MPYERSIYDVIVDRWLHFVHHLIIGVSEDTMNGLNLSHIHIYFLGRIVIY